MRTAALLLLIAHVAHLLVIPMKLAAVVNQTKQAEVLTERDLWTWTTTVIIGTPGTAFTVAIDTTSSLLFVPDVSTGRNVSFDATKSSTYSPTQYSFEADIEDQCSYGGVYGPIGIDTVILGESFSSNPTRTSITISNATFGHAKSQLYCLPDGVDGTLGLAFPSLAPNGSTPVFWTAIKQNDVANGMFVTWLEDQGESSDNGTHGVIYYGNVDNLHCKTDQRQMYPLSMAEYFQFTVPSVTVSGAANTTWTKKTQAIIDSKIPYIVLPYQLFMTVWSQLSVNITTLPILPCNTKIDLALNMPGGKVHVNDVNLLLKISDGTCKLMLNKDESITLGIPFLRGRCTCFDVSHQQIGFSEPLTHGGHSNL